MRLTPRRILIATGILAAALFSVYWFLFHTQRGSSWALYALAGIHAPLGVKWECGITTDALVASKFELPLKFTQADKNDLRGFWYYSYYRQCLFRHGYDFSGKPIPTSTMTGGVYTNVFAGLSFAVPDGTVIVADNLLNVDFEDHQYLSELVAGGIPIVVHVYQPRPDPVTLASMSHLSTFSVPLTDIGIIDNPQHVHVLRATTAQGYAVLAAVASDGWNMYVFGPRESRGVIDTIFRTLTVTAHP